MKFEIQEEFFFCDEEHRLCSKYVIIIICNITALLAKESFLYTETQVTCKLHLPSFVM